MPRPPHHFDLEAFRWRRPLRDADRQGLLFGDPVDETLMAMRLNPDDVRRWREKGWLRLDPWRRDHLHAGELREIRHVAAVAASGLPDAFIGTVLQDLPAPAADEPEAIAYSFTFGWVRPVRISEMSEYELDDTMRACLTRWIEKKIARGDVDAVQDLCWEAGRALDRARERRDELNAR